MPTNIRDPRSIITPDAFGIDEGLLGIPLAGPWRRFWAMMIDLVVIGILTVVTGSVQLIIWGAVALFFVRVAFQKPGRASQAAALLLRVFAGCLGLTILSAVVIAFLVIRAADEADVSSSDFLDPDAVAGAMAGVEGAVGREALRQAETPDEVVETARGLLEARTELGAPPDDPAEYLEELEPDEAPWLDDADSLFALAIQRWRAGPGGPGDAGAVGFDPAEETVGAAGPDEAAPPEDQAGTAREPGTAESGDEAGGARGDGVPASMEEEVEAMSDAEALAALAALVRPAGDDAAAPPPSDDAERREAALRRRVTGLVAADTLEELERALRRTGEQRDDYRDDVRELRQDLEEERGGFTALLRDIWDQAGSAIGLWSIYFTVLLTLWKGQTVGKKMMGIRVLRLDGEPMTWWSSFERGGGYVAGIATGLLGFAQVFWDANRQCIHDKIVGTVVVREGASRVPGSWMEAHGAEVPVRDAPRPGRTRHQARDPKEDSE